MWFLNDPGRLQRERDAVDKLQQQYSWLDGVHWALDPQGMFIDCIIVLSDEARYPVRLRFPDLYPSAVPSARPREKERWSDHQYGSGGDLCLELGPDNWHPDYHLAANMLESTHNLLVLEAEHEQDESVDIPSRHELTDGQRLRTSTCRFVLTPEAEAALNALPAESASRCHIDMMYHDTVVTAFLSRIEIPDTDDWIDPNLPTDLKRLGSRIDGAVVTKKLGALQTAPLFLDNGLKQFVSESTLPTPKDEGADESSDSIQFLAVRTFGISLWQLYWQYRTSNKVTAFTTVRVDTVDSALRLGTDYEALTDTTVAVVGSGSAGSKIASMLARAGVGNFVLVDDDLLHPSNLVRHDSDWFHVGQHKVDAVADRLKFINDKIKITRRKHRLGGQEAPTAAASALAAIGGANIIIDATANPVVFNLCAHVARQSQTPLLWLEVYAGGIGGLVARARPNKDAEPFTLREAINTSAREIARNKGVDPPESIAQYTAAGTDEQILIATDADVTVIAACAAQMTQDALLAREPSAYPHPAYLFGFSRSWIFEQPYHVHAMSCSADTSWSTAVPTDDTTRNESAEFIKKLLEEAIADDDR